MQIKEVEEQTGLTRKSIRYYEDSGLINVEKMKNGYKNYKERDIEILKKIKQLRLLDFSIQEIIEYQNGDTRAVVEKRMIQNETNIKKALEIDKYLKKLLNEDEFNVEQLLKEKVQEQSKMIRYNWLFGMSNICVLIVVGIITWCNRFSILEENLLWIGIMGWAILTVSLYQQERKNKELKKEGKLIYIRTKIECIYQILRNIFPFFIGITVIRSCLSSVGTIDWFNTTGNIVICLFMSVLMILLVVLSFADSQRTDMEYSIS
ncbi:MAG: MerR family transcriptional regulator [Lachnotalea sp.]